MTLKVLGSSSDGNCYLLQNETETLIIEAGIDFRKIQEALNFDLAKVVGCIVTHEHGDHAKGVKGMTAKGIDIYATSGTHKGINLAPGFKFPKRSHRQINITPDEVFNVGPFKILPFSVMHDAYQPVGFVINHKDTGSILFITDSNYVEQTFIDIRNIIVEANFCQKILDKRMRDGETPGFLANRVFSNHMNLKTTKELLQANDLTKVNNIVLIHLSEKNSDAKRFQREVTEVTGKLVHIAKPGLKVNFSKKPF